MINKIKDKFFIGLLLFAITPPSCRQKKAPEPGAHQVHCQKIASLPLKYAKGFTIDYYGGFKIITVRDSKDSSKIIEQYALLPKGKCCPVGFEDVIAINTPVLKVVCVSTPHIAELARLNLLYHIAAVTNPGLICNREVLDKIRKNEIADIGNEEVNYEKLLELHPSFVFTEGSFDGGDKLKLKLQSLHIKSVLNLDYREQDPLARAEWIKFMAAFFDQEYVADSIFTAIEKNYLELKEKASKLEKRPTVFCNLPFKEIWYMPCGENYLARIIDDAGGDFLWKDSEAGNGYNQSLNYEAVYNKAAEADFWINPGTANSLDEIRKADKKNTFFKAFKTGNIYNSNKRTAPGGGVDFWESGVVNPDKILADLLFIFHPDLLKEHEFYYFQKLK